MNCPTCGTTLRRLDKSSEPEGIRKDAQCRKCGVTYMVTKAALVKIRDSAKKQEGISTAFVVQFRRKDTNVWVDDNSYCPVHVTRQQHLDRVANYNNEPSALYEARLVERTTVDRVIGR